jgi:hypothetical protein
METAEEIIGQAIRLALAGGVGLPIVLGIVVVLAVLLVIAKRVKLPTPKPEEPRPDAEPWTTDADHPGGPGGGG